MSNEEEKLKKYDFYTDRFKDHLVASSLSKNEATLHINELKK